MVRRDFLVQWRDKWEFVFRAAMLPFILILLYGWMLPAARFGPAQKKLLTISVRSFIAGLVGFEPTK